MKSKSVPRRPISMLSYLKKKKKKKKKKKLVTCMGVDFSHVKFLFMESAMEEQIS